MGNNIDDLADDRALGIQSPGENYHGEFLLKRPKAEWPSYIDETAKDLSSGIQIGDLSLARDNFGAELGTYYRRGLTKTSGQYADLPAVLDDRVSDQKLGFLAYQLNELSYEISASDVDIADVASATEAVIEKLLTRHAGEHLSLSFNLSGASVSDITTQLFNNEVVASNVDQLLSEIESSASQGLLSLLDEPQMMTPLWAHQRDALQRWWENDQRGYVDMATATGKTVLGLAAIALEYGELHPADQAIGGLVETSDGGRNDNVLIIAHSELILEQWRREFENHLNIPQERTSGSDTISLDWGTIYFRTPQSLINEDRVDYDLVLLDEAHHYATGSEWSALLDGFDSKVLAMSGSVDDAGSDSTRIQERLSNSIGPEVKRYTITEARADGVIPSFDWEIHYAPYEVAGDDLARTARRAEQSFQEFQQRLDNGELAVETDRRLQTYQDVRRFSHTTEGNALKQQDEEFRDLVTRLFSRRTKQWNLSPVLDTVVDLVVEHHTTEKVVVLADSNAQVEELESRLTDVVANPSSVYLVSGSQSKSEQRETIDAFDEPESTGILIGTGDLLGEGVDMQHASVAINMATGDVNQELVQRIGRVLRNPADTPKHAMFYNVVGVPPSQSATVPREDGKQVIEQAAAFCSLGRRFEKLPGFAASESVNREVFAGSLENGAAFIDSLATEYDYDWETDTINEADLRALHSAVTENGGDVGEILGAWEEYAWEHSEDENEEEATDEASSGKEADVDGDWEKAREQGWQSLSSDQQSPADSKREQIEDLVRHQPLQLTELAKTWQFDSGEAVNQHLQSELAEYHFRDADGLIWASDKAEAITDDSSSSQDESTQTKLSGMTSEQVGQPERGELIDELRRLRAELGEPPSESDMDSDGVYSVSEFKSAFGSWSDALEAAGIEKSSTQGRQYSREDVLSGLQDVAVKLGKSPSSTDINEHAPFSAAVVYNYFDSITDARQAAGVERADKNTQKQTESSGSQGKVSVQANPLAEYYELFRLYASLLERIIESEQTSYKPDGDHAINQWATVIDNVVFGSGLTEESPGYGEQQGSRNTHTMDDYRQAHGNGTVVTEYQFSQAYQLEPSNAEVLFENGIVKPDEDIFLPVAPKSETALPIVVSSADELNKAMKLLRQFPSEPGSETEAKAASQSKTSEDSTPSDQQLENQRSNRDKESGADAGVADQDSQQADTKNKSDNSGVEQTIFWDQTVDPVTEYKNESATTETTASAADSLDKKIDEWKSQLLDLTRRNKLVSFKPTKTKSLPVENSEPTTLAEELNAETELYVRKQSNDEEIEVESDLAPNELLPTRTPDEASDSLYQLSLKNKRFRRERGVDSLYLSLGMLRWFSVDYSDEANRSPLFLAPVELEQRTVQSGDKHNYVIKPRAEGLRVNPALRKKLAAEQEVDLPADSALSLDDLDAAFEAVYESVRGFERWTIQPDIVLGIFDFTKFSLYSDLERNRSKVKSNPIIQALSGNMAPLQRAEGDITTPEASELDDVVDPVETHQVLDADSSQQEAIEAAKRGKSFVLQGPPGTGKSQTIANIIAEKMAEGERVLFVSEKQAALDVVKNRLDSVGLGRFCLEIHGEKATKADVLGSLETELKASAVSSPATREKELQKLKKRQEAINRYGQQLFYSPDGWSLTAYQAFGVVSKYTDAPQVEINIAQPLQIDQEAFEEAIDELEALAQFDGKVQEYEKSLWRHTTLTEWGIDTGESIEQSLRQQVQALERLDELADQLESKVGIRPSSVEEVRAVRDFLEYVSKRPDVAWQKAFFDGSLTQAGERLDELAELEAERAELMDALSANYQRSYFSADGAELHNDLAGYGLLKILKPSYRSLKQQITAHTNEQYDPSYEQLLEDTRKLSEIQRIEERRQEFQGIINRLGPLYEAHETDWDVLRSAREWVAGLEDYDAEYVEVIVRALLEDSFPDIDTFVAQINERVTAYDKAAASFDDAMDTDEMEIKATPLQQASFSTLIQTLQSLQEKVPELRRWVRFNAQLETVRGTMCEDYVNRFIHSGHSAEHLVSAFKKQFYIKWLNSVYEQTDLGTFNADKLELYIEDFRELDQKQQKLAQKEIQHKVTSRQPSTNLEHSFSSEQTLLRREIEKESRHKPLRELFDEAGTFISRMTPCFMMSPLSVAQHLKTGSIEFDTVIFDEASQIMPQDAVSSLIRAEQAVIAGDTKQLPPTSFFQSDVETTEDVREDLDSILEEAASVLSEKTLRWHYRSKSEELIEFSNHHYYNNDLRTFPENDPEIETGVSFDYVEDGVYDRGGSRKNEIEAQRVIDLIEEHAEQRSDKSLGVVAFSSAQEQAIRDALAERREESPVLDAFVSQDDVLDEFFIKNLEMVQGDERDRMIFSVGYGPAQDGTISTNFGPLNKTGGERRLNVAVTRAKEHITVVCSMLPGEIDLSGSNSTGAQHFKNYLEYARNGEQALLRNDQVTETLDFDSEFEEAVYNALNEQGYDVVSQVQSSSYSIDLAIKHPDKPGKFVLGIECDGAAYHSSKTARDRDRTRQMVLEDLGWTIHRIWSPDWASNRDEELEKINRKVSSLVSDT
jgi:superfamily II DNA or RNA helicase/very-short-patch-repair endonuclease